MNYVGELCALLTACCWSCSALAFSAATLRVGPLRLNVTRLVMASVLLLLTVVLTGPEIRLSSSQLRNLVVSGIVGLVIGDTFLFKSYEIVGPRLGMLIMSAAPAFSAILAFLLLDEVMSWMGIVGMAVTLVGIAVVVLERHDNVSAGHRAHLEGIFFGFLAALGQGVALVLAKMAFVEGPINGFVATFIRIGSSVVIILPLARFAGEYSKSFAVYARDRKAIWLTLLGAFFGPYLGITFSLISVANTKVGVAATLMATVPIIMLPLAKYIQKERISWRAIVGAFVAVAGVGILFLR